MLKKSTQRISEKKEKKKQKKIQTFFCVVITMLGKGEKKPATLSKKKFFFCCFLVHSAHRSEMKIRNRGEKSKENTENFSTNLKLIFSMFSMKNNKCIS
jgi:hypothetical protein